MCEEFHTAQAMEYLNDQEKDNCHLYPQKTYTGMSV